MAHYLFYFGPYKISPFNMKRVFDGKMIAPSEFLDDVEEVLNRYDKEPVYSKNIKSDYRWNVTQKLLYEDISYDYAIENGIAIIAESDVYI